MVERAAQRKLKVVPSHTRKKLSHRAEKDHATKALAAIACTHLYTCVWALDRSHDDVGELDGGEVARASPAPTYASKPPSHLRTSTSSPEVFAPSSRFETLKTLAISASFDWNPIRLTSRTPVAPSAAVRRQAARHLICPSRVTSSLSSHTHHKQGLLLTMHKRCCILSCCYYIPQSSVRRNFIWQMGDFSHWHVRSLCHSPPSPPFWRLLTRHFR